jgi:hypothetical protein
MSKDLKYKAFQRSPQPPIIIFLQQKRIFIVSRCGGEIWLLAFIEEAPVIERVLRHLSAWK